MATPKKKPKAVPAKKKAKKPVAPPVPPKDVPVPGKPVDETTDAPAKDDAGDENNPGAPGSHTA